MTAGLLQKNCHECLIWAAECLLKFQSKDLKHASHSQGFVFACLFAFVFFHFYLFAKLTWNTHTLRSYDEVYGSVWSFLLSIFFRGGGGGVVDLLVFS